LSCLYAAASRVSVTVEQDRARFQRDTARERLLLTLHVESRSPSSHLTGFDPVAVAIGGGE
jgi:hypothetical protein